MHAMIPKYGSFNVIKTYIATHLNQISNFIIQEQDFDKTYIDIANGLYKYASSTTPSKRINHVYAYPVYFHWTPEVRNVVQKGFLVHEVLSILLIYLQRNSHSVEVTANPGVKDKLLDLVHVISKYKSSIDKKFTQLRNLKNALDAKGRLHKKQNPQVSLKHLKYLSADIEEELHHDTLHMAESFGEY
jgi:hypothetical protein